MNKMIVTIFDDEKSAYEGLKALGALHNEASLTVNAAAVIAKNSTGAVTVKQADDRGPLGTFSGLAIGSLIGLLGGPIGIAVGATAGLVTGSIYDLATLGVGEDFLNEVSMNLTPGKVAVVADVDEEWVTPLDTRMETLGGIVYRRARGEFIDTQLEREIAAEQAEFEQMKAEYYKAVGEAKTKMKAKLDAAQKKFEAHRAQMNKRIDEIEREGQARVKILEDQLTKAVGDAKTTLEKRIAEERARNQARSAKLRQAWTLVQEAAAI